MIRNVVVGALTCCLIVQPLVGSLAYAAKEAEPVVAVLDFQNATGDPKLDYLGASIPEGLVTDLARRKGLRLAERKGLKAVMEEILLGTTGVIAKDQAAKVGEQLGATMVVLGSYTVTRDRLEIDARVVEVSSGEIVHAAQVEGKVKEHRKVVRRLGARLWASLTGKPVPKEGRSWYARWWVWVGLALIGGGVVAATQGGEPSLEPLPAFPAPPE